MDGYNEISKAHEILLAFGGSELPVPQLLLYWTAWVGGSQGAFFLAASRRALMEERAGSPPRSPGPGTALSMVSRGKQQEGGGRHPARSHNSDERWHGCGRLSP